MLTPKDIKTLIDYMKEVFVTKEDFNELKQSFSDLQTSVDNIARTNYTTVREAAVMAYRMKDAEDWIDQASPKLGLEFRH